MSKQETPNMRNVSHRGPDEFSELKIGEPVRIAAGTQGVYQALKHSFKEMGVLRSIPALFKMNQKNGFDCPSCAWPDPEHPSPIAEYCENGAKALADEATTSHIGADFFRKYSVEELSRFTDYQINAFGRLTEPLILRENSIHYEPVTWEESYDLIAEYLMSLRHPDEAIFYTSGRSSNEAAFLYGMFARALGTNNLPDCSNMCHESSGVALSETLGIGKGSVKLEDLYEAEVILIAGQNPGTNHPRMLSALEKCKAHGGKIVSINPLLESGLVNFRNPQSVKGMLGGGTQLADVHLPVMINQDIPLVKAIMKKLAALDKETGDVFDHDFIRDYTDGYAELMEDLDRYDLAELIGQTGVGEEAIDEVVSYLAGAEKIIVCWAMGLTQHKNSVATIKEYVNLLLLKGAIGKPNSGTCPVRGHSNVQGDRSVGIMHYVNKGLNERIEKHLGFTPPAHSGVDVVGAMQAMHDGKAKVFMCLGGNFLMAASDTDYTAEAIRNCELTVQVSTKLNRTHLVTGKTALILPTLGRSEKDVRDGVEREVTTENSMGRVRASKGVLKPASASLKSEIEIVAGIANAYFREGHPVNWKAMGEDYGLVREKIDLVAKGFEKTSERAKGTGYYLPNNARERDFSKLPNGRAKITVNPLPDHHLAMDEFMLMTVRSHDQFNTTVYGMDDRYRGIYNERRVLFMNPGDMQEIGLKKEDVVDLTSEYDGILRKAYKFKVVPYDIPSRNLAAYFPETNPLVPHNHFAEKSRTPISKSIRVRIEKRTDI
ncbi:oxidoreductase alpha (molybdopterin) subunit [Muriicola jejuensis]|uniref:FdhF/YdeP family oxidoreductase n=1 Tax=Muriicola jejuensis TaxID=504488 RepID=A0A6P0UDP8_9FLAO|nr:FdhF/YdeP family oxidoreductase [Muriicola jejuensis]NER11325.1 FdhF/YdeP family oxidoreductase [Muriicola jejuensis]SMP21419.1 oxidoreductase alpha (molybdopterin) subunit [Muriicola jejuensis]